MSSNSALMGHKPLTHDDALIYRGLLIISGSQLNPNKSLPFGPPRPADYHFESHAPSLRWGEAIAIFFILLFTGARLYTRAFRTKHFGIDDWVIIPGALGAIVYLALDIVSNTKGCLGKHLYDCTYEGVYWYMHTGNIQQPIFYFVVFTVKLSIALANKRITGLSSQRWLVVHWIFIGLFLCLLPICVFLQAFQCTPVPARYSLIYIGSMANPFEIKCLNSSAISLSTRIIHILTDVALLCVPITIVLRLRIPKRKKARITAIFALGGMSTIASIVRNVLISKDYDDLTWQYYQIYVWNTIDLTFGVIVASLPALNNLLDAGLSKLKTYHSRNSSKPSSNDVSDNSWHKHDSRSDKHSSDGDSEKTGQDKSLASVSEREGSLESGPQPTSDQTFEDFLANDRTLLEIPGGSMTPLRPL